MIFCFQPSEAEDSVQRDLFSLTVRIQSMPNVQHTLWNVYRFLDKHAPPPHPPLPPKKDSSLKVSCQDSYLAI